MRIVLIVVLSILFTVLIVMNLVLLSKINNVKDNIPVYNFDSLNREIKLNIESLNNDIEVLNDSIKKVNNQRIVNVIKYENIESKYNGIIDSNERDNLRSKFRDKVSKDYNIQ